MLSIRKAFIKFMLILFFSTGLAFLPTPPVWSHSDDVLSEFGTATVDGVISGGEYGDSCIGPVSQTAGSTTYMFTFCETNDENNDYYAFIIDDLTDDPEKEDSFLIFFDDEHDGAVADGAGRGGCGPFGNPVEDFIGFFLGFFTDSFYCFVPPFSFGFTDTSSVDGNVVREFTEEGWVYEFSHPLNSGDPEDYSLALGDTVGFCLTYDDGSNLTNSFAFGELQFPPGCFLDAAKSSTEKYGDVVKISELDELLDDLLEILAGLREEVAIAKLPPPRCLTCPPNFLKKLDEALMLVMRANDAGPPEPPSSLNMLRVAIGQLQGFMHLVMAKSNEIDALNGEGTASEWVEQANNIMDDIQAVIN